MRLRFLVQEVDVFVHVQLLNLVDWDAPLPRKLRARRRLILLDRPLEARLGHRKLLWLRHLWA